MSDDRRIIQIIPALPGWCVASKCDEGDGTFSVWTEPVACWALVEEGKGYETFRYVCGMNAALESPGGLELEPSAGSVIVPPGWQAWIDDNGYLGIRTAAT